MGRLADQAFDLGTLRRAWSEVLANDRVDGALSAGVTRFEDDAENQLGRLVTDLAWGAYEPRDLTEVVIDEASRRRRLHIPAVRDRVVERAVMDTLTPVVDPVLGPASFAYRPGLGVADAVQALVALREEGLGWVLRTDIDECFPSIPVGLARRRLGALVDDPELLRVVDLLLARPYRRAKGGRRIMRGLAQGCALSPMLTNLVLVDVDDAVMRAGFPIVRYADDISVAASSRDEAWEAARCVACAAEELGMQLGAEDTHVMSFEEGFTFLGEDFGVRYPPALPEARIEEPDRKVVYVGLTGSRVRIANGRLIVESADDAEVLDVPTSHVRRVVCFGSVGFSAGARSWALSNDVDVCFASRRGSYLGSFIAGRGGTRADRVRRQLAISGTPAALRIAKAIVEAKISKQIVILQRFGRRDDAELVADAIASMRNALMMLPDATTSEQAMGLEGAAAAAYFPAYGSLLPDELSFTARSRQPPLDVANSALSFLYTVALGECVTALYAAGLDPAIGVLHADHENRPSLALDLLEELRPMIVDQVVAAAARTGALKVKHGRTEEGRAGVLLTKAGRAALLTGYERRMLTRTRGALPDCAGSLRRHVYRQAQRLQAAICRDEMWTGMSWR